MLGVAVTAPMAGAADLLTHWAFDEGTGTTAFDSQGLGLDGTLTTLSSGQPSWTTDSKLGDYALSFVSASGHIVDCGANNAVTALAGPKAFTFWTKPSTSGGSKGFIGCDGNSSTDRWYLDDSNNAGKLRSYYGTPGGSATLYDIPGAITYNAWQQVAVVDDGSAWHVYVNGTPLTGSGGVGSSFDLSSLSTAASFKVGAARFSGGYQSYEGVMDDVATWNSSLSTTEVKTLYNVGESTLTGYNAAQAQQLFDLFNAGAGKAQLGSLQWQCASGLGGTPGELSLDGETLSLALDGSGNGVAAKVGLIGHWTFDEGTGQVANDSAGDTDGTLGGSTASGSDDPAWSTGKLGDALDFDGGDVVMTATDSAITNLEGPKTFSLWANTDPGVSCGFITVNDGTSANRWYLDDRNNGNDLRAYRVVGGSGTTLFETSGDALEDSVWQHIVVVDDGNKWTGYLDGEVVATGASGSSFDFSEFPQATTAFKMGRARHAVGPVPLRGKLDDVAVWNVALSATQVRALHNLGDEPTLAYDAGQAQRLFTFFDSSTDNRSDGSQAWLRTTGLTSAPGTVQSLPNGRQAIALDASGNGVQMWSGLIGHWAFDGAATDAVAGNNGSLVGDPQYVAGKLGGALEFDGNDHVTCGGDNLVTTLSEAKTFAFWVNVVDRGAAGRTSGYIGVDNNTAQSRWFVDDNFNNDGSRIYRQAGSSGSILLSTSGTVADESWNHVVVVDNGSTWSTYVNGALVATGGGSFDFTSLAPDSVFNIGRVRHGGAPVYMTGMMDDIGAWNVALDDAQIAALFSLAEDSFFGYDLGEAQQLFDLHAAGTGALDLGAWTWEPATGLSTDLGIPTRIGDDVFLRLDGNGGGVRTFIPEPASIILLAAGLPVLVRRRRKR